MTPAVRDMGPLAEQATSLLKALAHPARLMICCQLKEREMSVGEIEETLDIKQPRLSRELSKLREEGLVETRRESKVVFYRLSDKRARAMVDAICAVMLGRADFLKPAISEAGETAPRPNPRPNLRGGYGVFARTNL
ncbi:MAG: metalloregulator ArsR/SmtB family transcription factor [Pseudomonadota bacterium]